jgi:hypothetical protein
MWLLNSPSESMKGKKKIERKEDEEDNGREEGGEQAEGR